MNIADDNGKLKQRKPLAKSLEAIAALRAVMEMKLAQGQKDKPVSKSETPQPRIRSRLQVEPETPLKAKHKAPRLETTAGLDPSAWPRIMMRIAERGQKLIEDFALRNRESMKFMPPMDPAHLGEAFAQLSTRIARDPKDFIAAQVSLWNGYAQIWQSMLARLQRQKAEPAFSPAPGDKRFQDDAWQDIWFFDYVKQTYLLTASWMHGLVRKETEGLDPKLAHKIDFYTNQMVDAIAPNNFWLTNPEVLRTTFETGGENLVKGLENLLEDLERGQGNLRIRMSDPSAFKVGENLAITKGKVVFQNELMQLIQYEPLTPDAHKVPLLIIPPWINKFYILDLREKNSFIRYLVSQGHTVFCVSWVNPDERFAKTDFDDYMSDGVLAGMREVKRITGEDQINLLGYCIGGTVLSATLAWLKAQPAALPDLPRAASATFLVTMIDFSEPGDLGVFIDDAQIAALERRMNEKGYLEAAAMSSTFNLLRANDLIWSFVINNYLLGKEPFPFDILYWNADSTNLSAAMHGTYLRKMYLENKLIEPNGFAMKGVPVDLQQIDTPSFLLSTRDDHIAPWHSTYAATQLYKGPVRFVLAGSGHIAGIVNPPVAEKYGYWTNEQLPAEPEDWLKNAVAHKGSWWPEWLKWLVQYAGEKVPARAVKDGIENAPGSYAKVRAP